MSDPKRLPTPFLHLDVRHQFGLQYGAMKEPSVVILLIALGVLAAVAWGLFTGLKREGIAPHRLRIDPPVKTRTAPP